MTLADIRADLHDALTAAGWEKVLTYSPERFTVPLAYLLPDSPYLTSEGARFGHLKVGFEVRLVVGAGTNERQTTELDTQIESTIIELITAGISVGEVTQPYALLTDNGTFTAVSIHTTSTLTIGA